MEKSAVILLPWIKTFFLITLLISSSQGTVPGFKDGMEMELTSPRSEVMLIQMKARKLNGFEMLDYPDPSANPIHGPKKGNSGGRGGNSP
ncbi:hypothetical protein FH972_011965 [Carpinus fangiana]|uniref:Uncharacterized protein n=1 Tax=Carpinus fangiana TaxID=176857 RepID=A0A5N6R5H0_9ROSI|nr:hypothetical protein FH972_011965 [Carpinus fangiana]